MRIIVNADDLGCSKEVNDCIFEFMAKGYVTSATLIANAPCVEEACRTLQQFRRSSFGVHLNITEFHPLSKSPHLRDILAADGSFNGHCRSRVARARKSVRMFNAITEEFCAQIERLLEFGVNVTHIDSHHHVHTLPLLFPALKYVQRKYRIEKVRIARNLFAKGSEDTTLGSARRAVYNYALRRIYPTVTTSWFCDLPAFVDWSADNRLQRSTVEIMVHPWNRHSEEKLLANVKAMAEAADGIRLINYADL